MVYPLLPGCALIGGSWSALELEERLSPWKDLHVCPDLLVVLAATRTAEVPGISAAGSTPESRRYTAIADAELLLQGPASQPRWPLPPLPAGVSPALISWVAVQCLRLRPQVAALGLAQHPLFPHLRFEAPCFGAAACLSSGRAMDLARVLQLWERGRRFGAALRRPLVLAECVPGGTTTAQAVLRGLGMPVDAFVSGSALHPPVALKRRLVAEGLERALLPPVMNSPALIAAVGDPFQALAAGVAVGAMQAGTPLLLAGGSQMLAVAALALSAIPRDDRASMAPSLLLGTTAWLADEQLGGGGAAFPQLLQTATQHLEVPLLALASGLRFDHSRHGQLQAYEQGHVKEGVGAGGLALLAQLRGCTADVLLQHCDLAMDALLQRGATPSLQESLGSEP